MNNHKHDTQYANFPCDVSSVIVIEFQLITNVPHFTLHYYIVIMWNINISRNLLSVSSSYKESLK